jgi:hypothetical protein
MAPSRAGTVAVTLSRWLLGAAMMPYAVSKLLNWQFQVAASVYANPLGETPSRWFTWAFLGYSPAFQFLMGLFEFVPAVMLLSRRTWRLGSLLLFPVLLNVVMTNYFLDLWPETRLISTVLLALNLFLVLYDWRLYGDLLSRVTARPAPIANRWLRMAARAGAAAAILGIGAFVFNTFFVQATGQMQPIADFTGTRQINRAGTWSIQDLQIAGRQAPFDRNARLYFDFGRSCVYFDGSLKHQGKFEANRSRRTFKLTRIPLAGESGLEGTYELHGDELVLSGLRGKDAPVRITLRRSNWGRQLPFER